MDKLRAIPPAGWFALVVLAALVVLVWHRWVLDAPADASWLDDDQPPLQASAMPELVLMRARGRSYPATLREWPHSPVGDC